MASIARTVKMFAFVALLAGCAPSAPDAPMATPEIRVPASQMTPAEQDLELMAYRDEEPYRVVGGALGSQTVGGSGVSRREILELIEEIHRRADFAVGPLGVGDNYRFQPGDVVDVSVHARPEFSGKVLVRSDGVISLRTIKANVLLKGLTPVAARQSIAAALFPKYLRKKPFVSVHLSRSARRYVYVFGEVARPGQYLIGDQPITALTAYLAAHDAVNIDSLVRTPDVEAKQDAPAPAATQLSRIARRTDLKPRLDKVALISPDEGGPVRQIIDLNRVRAGDVQADPILRPRQILYVPSVSELKDKKSAGWKIIFGRKGRKLPSLEKLEAAAGINVRGARRQ